MLYFCHRSSQNKRSNSYVNNCIHHAGHTPSAIILCMRPANERWPWWHPIVTSSLSSIDLCTVYGRDLWINIHVPFELLVPWEKNNDPSNACLQTYSDSKIVCFPLEISILLHSTAAMLKLPLVPWCILILWRLKWLLYAISHKQPLDDHSWIVDIFKYNNKNMNRFIMQSGWHTLPLYIILIRKMIQIFTTSGGPSVFPHKWKLCFAKEI